MNTNIINSTALNKNKNMKNSEAETARNTEQIPLNCITFED